MLNKLRALAAPNLIGITLPRFQNVEIPSRKWIVPNYIPDETVTMLSGDGGTGKTLLAIQAGVGRALGREWIGLMPESGRTLMLSCEDDENELLRRIDYVRKFHGVEWTELGDFIPVDMVGADSILGLLKQGIIEPTPTYRAAIWTESERDRKPLRPLGESGEEKTLNQLEAALRDAREAPGAAVARIQALTAKDIADLVPTLEKIAAERVVTVAAQLVKRGEEEARSLSGLLEQQRSRIAKAANEFNLADIEAGEAFWPTSARIVLVTLSRSSPERSI
ncbi:MAG: AAA family ATPase [Methylocella sp.]